MSVEFHCVAVFEASCCIDFNDLLVFLYMHLFITNIISKHAGTPTLVYMMFLYPFWRDCFLAENDSLFVAIVLDVVCVLLCVIYFL